MKTKLLAVCLLSIFCSVAAFGQLSKSERREWRRKAKEFKRNPANLKQFTEEKQEAVSNATQLGSQVKQLQSTMESKDARIGELESQLAGLRSQLGSTRAELEQLKAAPPVNPMDFSKGVVFRVQIGAFRKKDLSRFFDNNPNFGGEAAKGDEPQRITIGIFRDYWEADTFKKYLREMGVKDAWIVPFRDGQRVDIKDVLEGVVADKQSGK
jgi:TolA-binding protein